MSVSKKQLQANRQNAKRSTGPKTVEGKEIAAANAVKFGLHSQNIIINSANYKEDPEAFINLLNSLIFKLNPDGAFQLHLVHKIANCLWRSQRVIRAETAIINHQLDHIDRDVELRNQFFAATRPVDSECDDECDGEGMSKEEERRFRKIEIGRQSIPQDRHAINILRYEMRLDRQLTRAYKLLIQLQTNAARQLTEDAESDSLPIPIYVCPMDSGQPCSRPATGRRPPAAPSSSPLPLEDEPEVRENNRPRKTRNSKNDKTNPFSRNGKEDMTMQGIFKHPPARE